MTEPEGEGKFSGVRKDSQGGRPKVQGVGELGDSRLGKSRGSVEAKDARVTGFQPAAPQVPLHPTALAQGQRPGLLFPSISLTLFLSSTQPRISLGPSTLFTTRLVCLPSSPKTRWHLEGTAASLGRSLRAPTP